MSLEIVIAGPAARVKIEVLGYENPSAQDPSDANWLTCRVEVRVRSFSGQVEAAFTTQDFAVFGRDLRSAVEEVKGAAAFETDENVLQLNVEFTHTGAARISGTLQEADRPQTSITFSFESDQTYLSRTADALDELIRLFPIRVPAVALAARRPGEEPPL